MADYSLGTAEGQIKIGYDGKGVNQAGKGLDDLQSRARNVQQQFQTVATVTAAAAGVIVGGIALAVNAAIDFERRISAIGAVSGASADELELLRKKALQLGADTAFSASEAAVAMEELVKSGLSVEDVLNGAADATVALAAAGEVALPEAAKIAANAMNQFNLAASELPKVADLIAGAANASAIDVGEFGFALSQAGAVANLVGLSFGDLATAIALMGNAGIKGSDAGTSLKTMLQNLQPTTKKQIELMKDLGIVTENGKNKFFDQRGELKSLSEVAGILNGALKGMSSAQKAMALETIFGSDAIRAAAVLANEGAAGFDEMARAMGEVTAQDVAAQRLDNVAGAIEQLKGSVETAAIAFGSALLPTIRKVTEFVTMLVNKFSALDPKWQKLIAFAAVAAAALLGLIAVIAGVGAVIAGLVASVAAIKVGAIIAGIVAAIIAIATAIKLAYDRSQEFRDLIGKIAQVAKAAFAAVLSVVRPLAEFFRDEIIPAVREMAAILARNLQPALRAIGEFVQGRVLPAIEKLRGAFEQAMPTILQVGRVILEVAKFILNVLGKALGFIIPLLLKIIGPIFSALITVISAVIGFIPELVNGFKTFINVLMTIGKIIAIAVIAPFYAIYQAGKFVFEQLVAAVTAFVNRFMTVWNFLWPAVKAVFDLIASIVGLAFDILTAMFQAFWAVVTTIWNALWKFIIGPTINAMNAVRNAVGTALSWISDKVSAFWGFIRGIWDKVYSWIVPPIINAFNATRTFIEQKLNEAKAIVTAVWNAIAAFILTARDKIINTVRGLTAIVTHAREAFQNMKDAAIAKANELISWVKGLPGRILSALGNLGSALFNAGRSLLQGFWNGLKSIWDSIVGWLESKMSTLRGLWPFSPAKWGPFSGRGWVLYSGRALMEGFAEGMDDRVGQVTRSAERALAGVASSLPTDFAANVSATTSGVGTQAGIGAGGGAGASSTTNTSNTTVNVNVPLEDLRSIRDVQDLLDFIDRLRNDSRRGVGVGVT